MRARWAGRRHRRSTTLLAGLVVALTCSACGSTVQRTAGAGTGLSDGTQTTGSDPQLGTGGSTGQAGGATGSTSGTSGAGQPGGATSGATGGTTSTSGTAGAPAPLGTGSSSSPGRSAGSPGTPVLIGYTTSKALSGVAGSIGLSGVDPGDTQAQVRAVVDDLNARGGLLGRKVVLDQYDVSTESNAQAMCAAWTQDAHVFAVVDSVNAGAPVLSEELVACLAKKRVPLFTGAPLISQLSYDRYPTLIAPGHAASERYMRGLVGVLVRDRYFSGWNTTLGQAAAQPVKIGINSFDTPGDQSRVRALTTALKAAGYDQVVVVKHPRDVTAAPSSNQSAVLRFKAEGVTHVFGASVLFIQNAESQGYRPRYAVDDTANTVQLMAKNAPKRQLHGSIGAGYLPLSEDDFYAPTTVAARRCLDIMRTAKLDTTNRFATTYMLAICDRFWVLERAVTASRDLSTDGVLSGLGRFPTGIDSAATYAMTLGARRHDGAFRLRGFSYVDNCSCFRLAGATRDF